MRFYVVIVVFMSLFIPPLLSAGGMDVNTCISQKAAILDDGVTSAEIIGSSVIYECKDAIDASIKEYGKPMDKDLVIREFTKRATAFVLENRKYKRSEGIEEENFIGAWHYTVRSKNGQPKLYKLLQAIGPDKTTAFIVESMPFP